MNIIDFHTHVFPDALALRAITELIRTTPQMRNVLDGTRTALRESMKTSGVSSSVTLPIATKPSQVQPINFDSAANNSQDLIAFGTLHPKNTDFLSDVKFLQTNGIKGVKFHPEYQDFNIDAPTMLPIYDALSSAGIIVLFHAGRDPGPFTNTHSTPEKIAFISKEFPNLKIIAAHMGGYRMWEQAEQELCTKNVYFDTSAVHDSMSKDMFVKIVNRHGAEKILFGSDSPWFEQKQCIEWIDGMNLKIADKEHILSDNAMSVLGIF